MKDECCMMNYEAIVIIRNLSLLLYYACTGKASFAHFPYGGFTKTLCL
ncbi:hypothetical protein [Chroococcidiopsis sp. SAG 2025]|nr:hypothetical protein [Chroococcidiopsis sp. SAG 2025]